MKMHMKTIHGPRQKRVSKRQPNFTPVPKTSKRAKTVQPPIINIPMNSEGIIEGDNSFLLLDDTFSGKMIQLEEDLSTNSVMEVDSKNDPAEKIRKQEAVEENEVKIEPMLSCTRCEFDCENEEQLTNHKNEIHLANDCLNCMFTSEEETVLKDHEKGCSALKDQSTKGQESVPNEVTEDELNESAVICGVCNMVFANISECEIHIKSHPSKCYACDFQSDNKSEMHKHELKHMFRKCESKSHPGKCKKIIVEKVVHKCVVCEQLAETEQELNSHMLTHNTDIPSSSSDSKINIQCDQCDFESEDVTCVVNHVIVEHRQSIDICIFCGYEAKSRDHLAAHMKEKHGDQVLLNVMSDQISQVSASFDLFEVFKVQLKDQLNNLIGGHNTIMQELFLLRNNQVNENRLKDINENRFKNIENSLKNLSSLLTENTARPANVVSGSTSGKSSTFSKASSVSASSPTYIPSSPVLNPPIYNKSVPKQHSTKSSVPKQSTKPSSEHPPVPKILFVGDSISGHANINIIANATRSKIITAKAYSAVYDDVTNKAKEAAFFPQKNFMQVVPKEATKDNFAHLIVQSGSVDITKQ